MRFGTRQPIAKDLADRVLHSLSKTDSFVMVKVAPSGMVLEVFGALSKEQVQTGLAAAGCTAYAVDPPSWRHSIGHLSGFLTVLL